MSRRIAPKDAPPSSSSNTVDGRIRTVRRIAPWPLDSKRQATKKSVFLIPFHLPRQPSSPETRLSQQLAHYIERYKWGETYMSLVPARLGYNRSVDLATRAVMEGQIAVLQRDGKARATSIRYYGEALDSLRSVISARSIGPSDHVILAVVVLIAYEAVIGTGTEYVFPHIKGIDALLRSLRRTNEVGEAALLIFDQCWPVTFLVPCACGTPSAYDDKYWLGLDLPCRNASSSSVSMLRKITSELFIRLPYLIALVRDLRDGVRPSPNSTAIALAHELLELQDTHLESEVLHIVNVVKTSDLANAHVVPVSFLFRTFSDYEAGAHYWTSGILLLRLCSKLQQICPEEANFDVVRRTAAISRMSINLLMSWQYASSVSIFGTNSAWSFLLAMIAIWGSLADATVVRDVSSKEVREWVLQRTQGLVGKTLTVKDMDETAELFVGGPRTGMIPHILGVSRRRSAD